MGVEVKGVGIKAEGIRIMRGKPKPSKSFIFSNTKKSEVLNTPIISTFIASSNSDKISAEGKG